MRGSRLLLLPAKEKRRTLATFAAIHLTIFIMRRASNVLTTSDALDGYIQHPSRCRASYSEPSKVSNNFKRVSDNFDELENLFLPF
jgi:hypothetical protein